MDKLLTGTWVVNSIKHLLNVKSYTPELSYFEATEQAGKAGLLLGRLIADNQEIIPFKKAKVFARQSGISPGEIRQYLDYLKKQGKVDYVTDINNNDVKEIEIYCFSGRDALETVGDLYYKLGPGEEERGNLLGLQATFELPRYHDELVELLVKHGLKEKNAIDTVELQRVLGLVKVSGVSTDLILYNEYAFTGGDPIKIPKALAGLSPKEKDMVEEVLSIIANSQGYLIDNIPEYIKPEIIRMMEGIGLIDGITVRSVIGEATFLTTPQLKGPGIGSFTLSDDIFHKAKLLLSCLRFGQTKSYYGRGEISTHEKMVNIVSKLNRGEWVGKCTAIGQDYHLLEIDGVIETKDAGDGMFYMRLRQTEVGLLVKQMLDYNKLILDADVSLESLFRNQPTSYEIPEVRKREIEALSTEPVKAMHERMLHSIRTGV